MCLPFWHRLIPLMQVSTKVLGEDMLVLIMILGNVQPFITKSAIG